MPGIQRAEGSRRGSEGYRVRTGLSLLSASVCSLRAVRTGRGMPCLSRIRGFPCLTAPAGRYHGAPDVFGWAGSKAAADLQELSFCRAPVLRRGKGARSFSGLQGSAGHADLSCPVELAFKLRESSASSAAVPGAPGNSPRPSTPWRSTRHNQDEKGSVLRSSPDLRI
jgi:hypothetical protein